MEPLVVKISKGGKSQKSFHKIDHSPFKIGRAYDNDLIIADDTVSPYHLEVRTTEDSYQLYNLSTENGTWSGRQEITDSPTELTLPHKVSIGSTQLNFISANTPVKATRTYARISPFSEVCSQLKTALVLLGVYFLLNLYFIYPRLAISRDWSEIIITQLSSFLAPLLLACIAGFLCRIFLHSWRIALQISIASLGFTVLLLLKELVGFISYYFTNNNFASSFELMASVLLLVGFLTWQLTSISSISTKKAFLPSLGIVLAFFLVTELQDNMNSSDFNPQPSMHTLLKRNDLRLASTDSSIISFVDSVNNDLITSMAEEARRSSEQTD